MKYLSVCAGIEAASVAWHDFGWEAAAYSEIEKFPSAVLDHHYPNVPKVGDMTKFKEWNIGTIDLLVGGTPCQSFSVAGLRKGLEDPRGNLALTYVGILDRFRPKWFIWENVPGVLSSGSGRDFGSFLGALGQIGYGFAYRVLDAQYFGVAQRRKRVFVVGCLGDWKSAAEVLFESHSLSGNPAPSRETWQKVAESTTPSLTCGYGKSSGQDLQPGLIQAVIKPVYALQGAGITSKKSQCSGWNEEVCFTLNCMDVHGVAQSIPFGVNEKPDVGHCLRSGASKADKHESTTYIAQPIAFGGQMSVPQVDFNLSQTLQAKNPQAVAISMAVRRLTPVECERLQGFPDNYTNIPWRNKSESPDGPRYKALGNSMAVPVMKWIGNRIKQKEST